MKKLLLFMVAFCLTSLFPTVVESPSVSWANKPKVCCKNGTPLQGLNEEMCKAAGGTWVDWDQCN
jgi:hypothetical protein